MSNKVAGTMFRKYIAKQVLARSSRVRQLSFSAGSWNQRGGTQLIRPQTRAMSTAMGGSVSEEELYQQPHVQWQRDMNVLVMKGLQEGKPEYLIDALGQIKELYSGPVKTRLRSRVFCAQSYMLHASGMVDKARENLEVVHDEATVPEPLKLYNIDMMGMLNDYAVTQLMSGRLDAATTALVKAIYWCHMELRVNEDFRRHFDQVQQEAKFLHPNSPLLSIFGMFLDGRGQSGVSEPEGMIQPPTGDPNTLKFHFMVRMKGPPKEGDPNSKEWVQMDSMMNKLRDPEYLNIFYALALNHMAEVEVRRKHYADALDILEDAWTVFCEDRNTDPSALHISAAIRTNLGACWRKYSLHEGVSNEIGERFAETAVTILDDIDPRLQFGLLHSAASVNLAIYKLQRPTLKRRRDGYMLANRALAWVQQLDEAHDGPHCIPSLFLLSASSDDKREALGLLDRVEAISQVHQDHLKEGGMKEVVEAMLKHNRSELLAKSEEETQSMTVDIGTGGLARNVLEHHGMVESVPLGKNNSERKLYVLGQSAFVLGIHMDGGLWNLDENDKRDRIEVSRWIHPSDPGGGYLPQRESLPGLQEIINVELKNNFGEDVVTENMEDTSSKPVSAKGNNKVRGGSVSASNNSQQTNSSKARKSTKGDSSSNQDNDDSDDNSSK